MTRPLNNAIRDSLAVQLAVMAVKRHGPAMGRLAKHLKKDHRALHIKRLTELEPDISLAKWTDLIQKRLVSGKGESDNQYIRYLKPSDKEGVEPTLTSTTIFSDKIIQIGTTTKAGEQRLNRYQRFIVELKQVSGFSTLMDMYDPYDMKRSSAYLDLRCQGHPDLPDIPNGSYLNDTIPAESRLIADFKATTARLFRILVEGWSYLEQCFELLEACKNEKQLEDLFPEAAKLLPPVVKKSGGMIPVELAAKVRKMLETGVPTE